MSLHPLISVDDLAASQNVHVCDLRWDLTDPNRGRAEYESGHLPGAVFVDLEADLSGTPGERGRHPLPNPARFAATLGHLGIGPDTHVVAYDDVGGRIAARLWWMLRAIGHEKVQVLDGGYQAWTASGLDIDTGAVDIDPTSYPAPEGFTGIVSRHDLEGRTLIDARAPERYLGETEPIDPKAGHIPGAINVPTEANLDADGRFRPIADLVDTYASFGKGTVVSCGSGVTACHDALAMVVAGHDLPDVYVGSFSEWSLTDLPVSTGPNP